MTGEMIVITIGLVAGALAAVAVNCAGGRLDDEACKPEATDD